MNFQKIMNIQIECDEKKQTKLYDEHNEFLEYIRDNDKFNENEKIWINHMLTKKLHISQLGMLRIVKRLHL